MRRVCADVWWTGPKFLDAAICLQTGFPMRRCVRRIYLCNLALLLAKRLAFPCDCGWRELILMGMPATRWSIVCSAIKPLYVLIGALIYIYIWPNYNNSDSLGRIELSLFQLNMHHLVWLIQVNLVWPRMTKTAASIGNLFKSALKPCITLYVQHDRTTSLPSLDSFAPEGSSWSPSPGLANQFYFGKLQLFWPLRTPGQLLVF